MTVQIEPYRRDVVLQTVMDDEAVRRHELVEQLGFNPELQLVDEHGDEAASFYPELAGFELSIWTLFHQSVYSKNKEEWSGYHFDRIPTEVLSHIGFAQEFGGFDDIELWTPERKVELDPMAVGVVGHRLGHSELRHSLGQNFAFNRNARFFPIVRWGESLEAFDRIKERALLNTIQLTHGFRNKVVPLGVLNYIEEQLHSGVRSPFWIDKASRLAGKHCGERRVWVSPREGVAANVCGVCGAH
ncbi:MAG TPA: hypothetical protein VMT23_00675 [Candidatus Binatia bacterium]|nr:hypothetical protein [Candidatus Binatia bacterium]